MATACGGGACAVILTAEGERPRVLCSGDSVVCQGAYLSPPPEIVGQLWLIRLENAQAIGALFSLRDPGPADLTLGLLQAWNKQDAPLTVFQRSVPLGSRR